MVKLKSIIAGVIVPMMIWASGAKAENTSEKKENLKNEFTIGYSYPIELFGGETVAKTIEVGVKHRLGKTETKKRFILPYGNFELLAGLDAGFVVEGPGSYMISGGIYTRYNIPGKKNFDYYTQLGLGIATNDIYKDTSQKSIGQREVFDLSFALGFKSKGKGFGTEISFRHDSWGSKIIGKENHWSPCGDKSGRNDGRNTLEAKIIYRF